MYSAERVVNALLDGKVGDWLADKWDTFKNVSSEVTGIGRDEFGMGKADKGFKPNYGSRNLPPARRGKRPPYRPPQNPNEPKVWEIG